MAGARRRGEELEDALLTAAWQELLEVGYPKLTMENVAARAGTSKPVIYRRWPTRPKLVIAALAHNLPLEEADIDTGSLRGDLIELVRPTLARAVARGELLTDQCSDRVLRLPFDLLRTETLIYGVMVDDPTITAIIDDIVLPVIHTHCGTPH